MGTADGDERVPFGVIFDTTSKGRFDLVIYDDGLLAVKGTYAGVALRGAGAGLSGAGFGGGATRAGPKLAAATKAGGFTTS